MAKITTNNNVIAISGANFCLLHIMAALMAGIAFLALLILSFVAQNNPTSVALWVVIVTLAISLYAAFQTISDALNTTTLIDQSDHSISVSIPNKKRTQHIGQFTKIRIQPVNSARHKTYHAYLVGLTGECYLEIHNYSRWSLIKKTPPIATLLNIPLEEASNLAPWDSILTRWDDQNQTNTL